MCIKIHCVGKKKKMIPLIKIASIELIFELFFVIIIDVIKCFTEIKEFRKARHITKTESLRGK